ncbi:E3 ubiquitin-protein ligase RHA2A [Punica granatum]|uniref:RING-type domain-containing protein n=2 Tax=Punica granatum TaxID=22663 RepID=A0A218XHB7_PUNGR|nr:E3 ubiquitin-protein ligase RHA2A [Punica granatum]OWM84079.1 hypothetical protein CDL15_Pgr009326 [Punica granatum]PKI76016.1 hypothetical protein CRG98_003566 [Punica granatum]
MEDSSSCFLLYKAALVFAIIRWALSWASKLRSRSQSPPSPAPSASKVSARRIRQNLALTNYGDIMVRHGHGRPGCETCAVCLSLLGEADEVRELRNCSHVFHRECIDRWVDHDRPDDLDLGRDCDDGDDDENSSNHRSCPLCRAPLLAPSQWVDRWAQPDPEPSWAVERILYLFGDDLLY